MFRIFYLAVKKITPNNGAGAVECLVSVGNCVIYILPSEGFQGWIVKSKLFYAIKLQINVIQK